MDSSNVFRDVTLFRRHPDELHEAVEGMAVAPGARPLNAADAATGLAEAAAGSSGIGSPGTARCMVAAGRAYAFWSEAGRHYFLGSTQGKSATRVLPGVRPMSVHTFYPPTAAMLARCWAGFRDAQDAVACSLQVVRPSRSPCILHYISCDFGFWHRKYTLLGAFTDKPGGAAAGGELPADAFHVQCRDLIATVDAPTARAHYADTVCLLDQAEARRQVDAAICMRITRVRDELARLAQRHESTESRPI